MLIDRKPILRAVLGTLGTLASVSGLVLQAAKTLGKTAETPVSWWLLLAGLVLVALLLLVRSDTVRMRWLVMRACREIKKLATDDICIAAGDCSWLEGEFALLAQKLKDGVHIRLLCRPTRNKQINALLDKLAACGNVEIRRHAGQFDNCLRCIIIDRKRELNTGMVLIDKERPASTILGICRCPKFLRRDHSATYLDTKSKTYRLMINLFNLEFEAGKKAWQEV